ncbi:MAG TPA: hypothetical protein VJS19_04555 [Candidatus Dormibacteraeota bacterium]|nr:hypothetical protein [Candidatus Dormibacteraeota bacterium]
MADHAPRPTTLDSYDLEEVEVSFDERKPPVRATRITIHGKNIFLRALEPVVRVGDVEVLYPRIQSDEQTIVGYLTRTPPEGARIELAYRGQESVAAAEAFTIKKLRPR